jgi:hypothetical protein
LPVHAGCGALPKKLFERVIASGNHLLTQVKDNQPKLRERLELGAAGRKPSGFAHSQTKGRNRWEARELTVFPAKEWFRHTPWAPLIKTVLRLERTVCRRNPATGLCKQTTETVFGSRRPKVRCRNNGATGSETNCASKTAAIMCAIQLLPRTPRAFERAPTLSRACDPSPTICCALTAATTSKTPQRDRHQCALQNALCSLRTKQP